MLYHTDTQNTYKPPSASSGQALFIGCYPTPPHICLITSTVLVKSTLLYPLNLTSLLAGTKLLLRSRKFLLRSRKKILTSTNMLPTSAKGVPASRKKILTSTNILPASAKGVPASTDEKISMTYVLKQTKYICFFTFVITLSRGFSQGAPACPSILAGPTQTITCGQCPTLTSTLVTSFQTTTYSVNSIPYAPYPFTAANSIPASVGTDDVWSPSMNIGFNFCYFGNPYRYLLVGSNGSVTFDTSEYSTCGFTPCTSPWSITSPLPFLGGSATGTNNPPNTICAAFRDIDVAIPFGSPVGSINSYTAGTAPCRYMVISWINVPLFNNGGGTCDGTPNSTFQCVLYENTNFIDVYIQNSFSCSQWNGGYGIIGIQNASATVAYCPPGRNYPNTWTANNEAWRFTPTGPGAYIFNWTGPTGIVGTTPSLTVCPPTTTTYTANMVITNCDGSTYTLIATQEIDVNCNTCNVAATNTGAYCTGQTIDLTATTSNTVATTYAWAGPNAFTATGSNVTIPNATVVMGGVYTVTATNSTGTCTATTTVTVNSAVVPTVNSATICAGNSGTLTATGATTYTWNTGATTPTYTDSPAATTVYIVTGAIGTCTGTATSTVTVNPLPTIIAPPVTICAGVTTSVCATGASTYTWNPGNMTGACLSVSALVSTNYTVTGTNAFGCVSTGSLISICPLTVIPPTVPIASSNTPCVNQALNLTCTPNGLTSYIWEGPNSYTTIAQNPIRTGVIAADAGTYTVFTVDANGCANMATIPVVINPLPVVTGSASPACINQTIDLFSTSGFASYSWSGPGFTSAVQNPTIPNVTPTMAGQYVVNVIDANGCTNGNTVQVTVYLFPTVTVTSATICVNATATLTASGALNYSWTPNTNLNGIFGSQVEVTPSSAGNLTYTVTGIDVNGCSNIAVTNVLINNLPVVTVAPDTTKGCTPQCASFTATTNSTATSYKWSFGNGQSQIALPPTNTAAMCYTTTGNYIASVTLTDINGCINSAKAHVITYPIPVPEFAYSPNPATLLDPTIQFINQSYGAVITSYNWNFGDYYSGLNASQLKNPVHTYKDTGTYYVTLIDSSSNGCFASITEPVVIEPDYTFYIPNSFTPNGDGKNEVFKAQGDGIVSFKMYVFDRWGNAVFTTNDINIGWNGTKNNNGGQVLQEDVYVWKVNVKSVNYQTKTYTGIVTLLK